MSLSQRGYLVVAPDMRGYGGTDQPQEVEEYNIYRLAGDALSLVSHMGYRKCLLVGHDWGAMIGYWLTLLHPDVFVAYTALSIPYRSSSSCGCLVLSFAFLPCHFLLL